MPFQDSIVMTYVAGCIGATVLEYVTSVVMELLFKVRYWDYSRLKFNFQGRICLGTTLSWGGLTILMTEILHVPVEVFVLSIPIKVLNVLTFFLTVGIVADFTLSFKAAVDLREMLIKMEQAKQEMIRVQKRLESILAAANQGVENYREALTESVNNVKESWNEVRSLRMEDVMAGVESKLESIKAAAQTKSSAYLESVKEEIFELKTRYVVVRELRRRLGGMKNFFQRNLLRSNPSMTSKRFEGALEELKQEAVENKEEQKAGKKKENKKKKSEQKKDKKETE